MTKWESGVDRICELGLLPVLKQPHVLPQCPMHTEKILQAGDVVPQKVAAAIPGAKNVELLDEWEKFILRFTIFYPNESQGDELMISTDKSEFQ